MTLNGDGARVSFARRKSKVLGFVPEKRKCTAEGISTYAYQVYSWFGGKLKSRTPKQTDPLRLEVQALDIISCVP